MTIHLAHTGACLALALFSSACSSTQPELVGPPGPELDNYTADEIRAEAAELLQACNIGERNQEILLGKLDTTLAAEAALLDEPGITGVVVYHSAGGGFIYAAGGGTGAASFKGGDQNVPFEVTGYNLGGTAGGGAHDGIALLLDLRDQRRFFGNYESIGASATGAVAQAGDMVAQYEVEDDDGAAEPHTLRAFATGYGLEVSATVGSFTIKRPGADD